MALVPEVKCPRCDRRYMALRTRCPYCGASRRRRTGKAAETDNAMWKTVVGSALMLALAVAVVVLIVDARKTRNAVAEANLQAEREVQDANLEKTVTSLAKEADDYLAEQQAQIQEETGTDPSQQEEEAAPVIPEIPIESVKLYIGSNDLGKSNSNNYDYDIRVPLGYSYTLSYTVVPESRQEGTEAVWSSEDTGVVSILQTGKITGMKTGVTYIHCKVENAEAVVIVRVS